MNPVTILIVEDETIVAADLANKLRSLGYEVAGSTDSGEEAIELAQELHPDLVLMDIFLAGEMDGVEAAERIYREHDLPVVFLTAHSDHATLDRAKLSEPFGFIVKPFEKAELEPQIEMALYKHQAERKLRVSENRYRLLFDRNPDAVFVLGDKGRFLDVNPAGETIFGYAKDELLPMSFMALCAPDQRTHTVEQFELSLHHHSRLELETAIIHRDGGRVEVWVVWEPFTGEDKTLAVHCTAKDITARKQEEEARQFLMKCGSAPGVDFFQELARYLAQRLNMDFVCIDRLEEGLLTAQTEAIYFDGKFEDNISYTLHDTPCGDVVGKTFCCFPKSVRHLYPRDAVLQEMLAESYVGTTLWGSQGQPIGLIAVIGRRPLASPHLAESIIRLSAVRAAGELERRHAEEALRTSESHLRQANDELEFWVHQRTIELQRTNLSLRMFSACNEALVRTEDELTLMQEICRIAVEIGGYRMAWIGMAEDDTGKSVRPVAYTGFEDGYLGFANISWDDTERGRGPTGTAIRTGKVQVNKDFKNDPRLAPWREEALRRGYRCSIAIPLRLDSAVVGALTIYSPEYSFFSEGQVRILNELADDLAFGISAIRMRKTVRENRDRLQALASELILTEQQERRRLATFLHDHLQQLLVGAKFRTTMLGRSVDEKTQKIAKEIEELLNDSLTASRTLTAELSPPILQKGGLVIGLEWLANWMADKHDLSVELALEPEISPVAEDIKVLVFESVRELLFNIVKHARTQFATVTMQQEGGEWLRIVVTDNGVGFDSSQGIPALSGSGGFGLFTIRERLDLLGGQLEVLTSPGKGCRFTITSPLGKAGTTEA